MEVEVYIKSADMEAEDQQAFETTADGHLKKPSRLNSDYFDSVVLLLVLIVGVPLNVIALIRLFKQHLASKANNRAGQDETRVGFLMLKIQLTLVDLLLLIFYIPPKLLWLFYYEWPFGTFVCKAVVYLWMFSHHLMSFAVMIIAIDRAKTVYDLMKMKTKGRLPAPNVKIKCIKLMIGLSYLVSAVFSLPQWFVWSSYEFGNWSQCTTIWQAAKARNFSENKEDWKYFYQWETIYSIVHLLTMFWIPLMIIVISYACIAISLCFYSSVSNTATIIIKATPETDEKTHILMENSPKIEDSQIDCEKEKEKPRSVPTWQTTMRSRMCHTSAQVIIAYLICWLPYNLMQISGYINAKLGIFLSVRFDSIFKHFVLVNTLVNPFIYGFHLRCCRTKLKFKKVVFAFRHRQLIIFVPSY